MFLFVTQAFQVFIVRICFFWCAICIYFKSPNGSSACDCWTQTCCEVMQRDSDIADSGKPRSFILCEEKHE